MKPVFRVESANEEIIRGGWYLLADSLAAAREVYPAHLFPSMTLIEVGKGLCVECNRRAVGALVEERSMGNDCWYYRAQYAGMTKVCMRKSIVERCRIVRFGLCGFPPDSEEWRRCGFAIGMHEIPLMVEE